MEHVLFLMRNLSQRDGALESLHPPTVSVSISVFELVFAQTGAKVALNDYVQSRHKFQAIRGGIRCVSRKRPRIAALPKSSIMADGSGTTEVVNLAAFQSAKS